MVHSKIFNYLEQTENHDHDDRNPGAGWTSVDSPQQDKYLSQIIVYIRPQ